MAVIGDSRPFTCAFRMSAVRRNPAISCSVIEAALAFYLALDAIAVSRLLQASTCDREIGKTLSSLTRVLSIETRANRA